MHLYWENKISYAFVCNFCYHIYMITLCNFNTSPPGSPSLPKIMNCVLQCAVLPACCAQQSPCTKNMCFTDRIMLILGIIVSIRNIDKYSQFRTGLLIRSTYFYQTWNFFKNLFIFFLEITPKYSRNFLIRF